MRALLVHNENAGTDPVPRADIEAVLHAAGFQTVYCEHGEEDLAAALDADCDVVIAAGGDGTVADVVSAIEDTDVPVAILALGGSNNIAHVLGADVEWREAPGRWSLDCWARLDRCEAEGPWGCRRFVEALGSGVLTDAVEEADDEPDSPAEKQANGREAFRKALLDADEFHCAVEADGWSWSGDCLMVEAMNIPLVGSRLSLAPGATPGDGLLDVVIVTAGDREKLAAWARDPDAAPCPVEPRKTASLCVTVKQRPFRLDDRSPNQDLDGTVDVRVRQSWVRVLLPLGDTDGRA